MAKKEELGLDVMPDTIKNYFRNKEIKDYYQSIDDVVEQM